MPQIVSQNNQSPPQPEFPQVLDVDLTLLGNRPAIQPRQSVPGPFVFNALYTDNTTTATNLRAAANLIDPALEYAFNGGAAFGADNPDIVLQVEAVGLEWEIMDTNAETRANLNLFTRGAYLRHQGQGMPERRFQLADVWGTVFDMSMRFGPSDVTAVNNDQSYRQGTVRELPFPLVVNMRTDTFELAFRNAVNLAGNIRGNLYLHGTAWSLSVGLPPITICPNARKALQYRKFRADPSINPGAHPRHRRNRGIVGGGN